VSVALNLLSGGETEIGLILLVNASFFLLVTLPYCLPSDIFLQKEWLRYQKKNLATSRPKLNRLPPFHSGSLSYI
jgi:hypothetical protein